MPPPLPPPAEAAVGMSAAAPMAATVAMAKIVLRIMGLSPGFLLDVLSTSCPSVGRTSRRVQWRADKAGTKSRGKERAAGKVRKSVILPVRAQAALVAVWPRGGVAS